MPSILEKVVQRSSGDPHSGEAVAGAAFARPAGSFGRSAAFGVGGLAGAVVPAEIPTRREQEHAGATGRMRRAAALALSAALAGAGCGPSGSGDVVSVARDLPPFDRISVAEGLDLALELEPGAAQQVTVTYDDNLVDRIGTVVTDGELHIEVLESFRVTGGGRFVTVVAGAIEVIRADSGADVRVSGLTEEITVEASGGAALDLSLLEARRVVVDAGGAAYVAVRASDSVTGSATGGAEVLVLGDPATVEVAVGGGATLVSE